MVFQEDFETGNFSKWNYVLDSIIVNSEKGKSLQFTSSNAYIEKDNIVYPPNQDATVDIRVNKSTGNYWLAMYHFEIATFSFAGYEIYFNSPSERGGKVKVYYYDPNFNWLQAYANPNFDLLPYTDVNGWVKTGSKYISPNVLLYVNDQLIATVPLTNPHPLISSVDSFQLFTNFGFSDTLYDNIYIGEQAPLTCPTSPKYEGDTVHLSATPRDGTGPYYVEFRKNNSPIASYSNSSENIEVIYDYILTNEDIRTALTGTIDFSVYMEDSCPLPLGPKTCTQLCTITIGCLTPVCNFIVT